MTLSLATHLSPLVGMHPHEPATAWSVADSAELYEVPNWGNEYFSIGAKGNLLVHPSAEPGRSVDLKDLVDRLIKQGIATPVLIRFSDLLAHRLQRLQQAFSQAISDSEYPGRYRCVYPVKVNQQRHVVEEVLEFGQPLGFGLEAGSKPELLAVAAIARPDTPIICNGFKDDRFIEMAMIAAKLGCNITPVVEKYSELELILKYAEKHQVRPQIGMRIKLASRGAGKWQASGGHRSKFGLTAAEILRGLDRLKERNMEDCLKLLHFHLGSQLTNIRFLKNALVEATRVYCDLVKRGAGLEVLDVGGGLGVDYDGSQSNFHSSMNYSLQEYANDVVHYVQSVCQEADVRPPDLVSESGRAVSAYHSVLVFNVLGVSGGRHGQKNGDGVLHEEIADDSPSPLRDLAKTLEDVTQRNLQETFHDAQQCLDTATSLFCTGHLTLEERVMTEDLYWRVCRKIRHLSRQLEYMPEELEGLDAMLASTYFCNFSLFQSLPDSWAIKQLFPIMPIHRLDERPTVHAVLGDVTCDSDGKVDQFIDRRDVRRTLQLHTLEDSPYYLAATLVGAYQEILGDLHNLFGDTNAVHVRLSDDSDPIIDDVIEGDTVQEALHYVQFNASELLGRFKAAVQSAIEQRGLNMAEGKQMLKFYEEGLRGYTYLDEPPHGG